MITVKSGIILRSAILAAACFISLGLYGCSSQKQESQQSESTAAQTEEEYSTAEVLFSEKYEYKYGEMVIGTALYNDVTKTQEEAAKDENGNNSFTLSISYMANEEGAYETVVACNSIYNGCESLKEMIDIGITVIDGTRNYIIFTNKDNDQRLYTENGVIKEGTPDWMPTVTPEELAPEFAEFYLQIVNDIKDFSEKYNERIKALNEQ